MRTFRVLRLFNKKSLRVLINALAASIFPVGNAFLMVVLVCVVYAILGVEPFSDRSPELFGFIHHIGMDCKYMMYSFLIVVIC